jgi:hypothetical protein
MCRSVHVWRLGVPETSRRRCCLCGSDLVRATSLGANAGPRDFVRAAVSRTWRCTLRFTVPSITTAASSLLRSVPVANHGFCPHPEIGALPSVPPFCHWHQTSLTLQTTDCGRYAPEFGARNPSSCTVILSRQKHAIPPRHTCPPRQRGYTFARETGGTTQTARDSGRFSTSRTLDGTIVPCQRWWYFYHGSFANANTGPNKTIHVTRGARSRTPDSEDERFLTSSAGCLLHGVLPTSPDRAT